MPVQVWSLEPRIKWRRSTVLIATPDPVRITVSARVPVQLSFRVTEKDPGGKYFWRSRWKVWAASYEVYFQGPVDVTIELRSVWPVKVRVSAWEWTKLERALNELESASPTPNPP